MISRWILLLVLPTDATELKIHLPLMDPTLWLQPVTQQRQSHRCLQALENPFQKGSPDPATKGSPSPDMRRSPHQALEGLSNPALKRELGPDMTRSPDPAQIHNPANKDVRQRTPPFLATPMFATWPDLDTRRYSLITSNIRSNTLPYLVLYFKPSYGSWLSSKDYKQPNPTSRL